MAALMLCFLGIVELIGRADVLSDVSDYEG